MAASKTVPTPPPVVMIHGAFCAGWTFERFRKPFKAAGHTVFTPDLPGHGPGENPAGLSMRDYAEAVVGACKLCDAPPLLIGHSLGGLAAAMAAARTPLAGLMLLAPSAPWGVTGASMEEAASAFGLYALGPFWLQAAQPDRNLAEQFSLDRLPAAERAAIFARMVPESGRALFETLNWWLDPMMTTTIAASPVPCLVIAGGRDAIHPPATVRQTAQKLGAEYQLYDEMSHWLPGEPGWDDVAAAGMAWLAAQAAQPA